MKTAIFYGCSKKLTHSHVKVSQPKQPDYFIRMETNSRDFVAALDKARPMEGEIVLNTVEIIER